MDQTFEPTLTFAFTRCGLIKGVCCISSCVTLTTVWCKSTFCTGAIRIQVGFAFCQIEYTLLLLVVSVVPRHVQSHIIMIIITINFMPVGPIAYCIFHLLVHDQVHTDSIQVETEIQSYMYHIQNQCLKHSCCGRKLQ